MAYAKTVDGYLENNAARRNELEKLRSILLQLPYEECIKWGMPTYTIDGKNVVGIGSFKNWSCLWFHQGAFLADKAKVLENAQEGKTKGMRQWRFSDISQIDEPLVKSYLIEAMENQKAGKMVSVAKKKSSTIDIPEILKEHLAANPIHSKAFYQLTTSQQNEYSNYLHEAKREKTKVGRLKKVKTLLAKGQKLSSLWSK